MHFPVDRQKVLHLKIKGLENRDYFGLFELRREMTGIDNDRNRSFSLKRLKILKLRNKRNCREAKIGTISWYF